MVKRVEFIALYRAVAAFWVVTAHCMIWGGWFGIPLPSAKLAVDLFMIISGYLMAANASVRIRREPLTNSRSWLRFWLRRFFRIAPAYYFALAMAIALRAEFLGGYRELQALNPARWPADGVYDPARIEYTFNNILMHMSFLFGLHPTYSSSTFLPDWSLGLEMQFYLVFPFLFHAIRELGFVRTSTMIGLVGFAAGYVVSKFVFYHEPSLILFKLNYFISGIMLFYALLASNPRRLRVLSALIALMLTSLDFRYRAELVVLPVLMSSMLLLGWLEATKRTPAWASSLVHCRVVRLASATSYGVYLFHGFFISAAGLAMARLGSLMEDAPYHRFLLIYVFVTAASYLFAYVVRRLVELPGIRFGDRVIEYLVPVPARADGGGSTT